MHQLNYFKFKLIIDSSTMPTRGCSNDDISFYHIKSDGTNMADIN